MEDNDLIEKHWNLVKDKIGFDGKIYHEKYTKEYHNNYFSKRDSDTMEYIIWCVQNDKPFHPV